MKYTKSSAWSKAGDPADRRVLLSVALPPWPPRRGWSQGRTPMATTAVRCCCHDAREWLVSWIGTVLSDSAGGGTLPHLGEETLAGCEMLVNKVIARVTVRPCQPPPHPHPPPLFVIEEFTAGPRATYEKYRVWIYPLFGVWLGLCLPLREVDLQTTMSWFEKKGGRAKTARTPFSQWRASSPSP